MPVISAPKVDIDTVTRIIQVTSPPTLGVVSFGIQVDLYSDLKEVWLSNEVLRKMRFPVRVVGGDPLPGSKVLGDTYFLRSDWKIRPYEGDHRFAVNGNFYSEDGTSPFTTTLGSFNVFMEHQVSSLVDSTVQQLTELEYASFNGGVTYDATNGTAGTKYPIGTPNNPVNNIPDMQAIAAARGFTTCYVRGVFLAAADTVISKMRFVGLNPWTDHMHTYAGGTLTDCYFEGMHASGTFYGTSIFRGCRMGSVSNFAGEAIDCLLENGTTTLAADSAGYLIDCRSGSPVTAPSIQHNGTGQWVIRDYHGDMIIKGKTGGVTSSMNFASGHVTIDSTNTGGEIEIHGGADLTNQAEGTEVHTHGLILPNFHHLHLRIESQSPTHQGNGIVIYCNPMMGSDLRDGTTMSSAVKTVTQAINLAVDGRGDVIMLLAPTAGAVTINERIVIDKEDLSIRGPSRGIQFQPSVPDLGPVITVDAYNVSMSGFVVRAPVGSTTDDCIVINGKNCRTTYLYLVGSQTGSAACMRFRGGDYHVMQDMELEKSGGSCLILEDAQLASGSPREISIFGGNIYLAGKDGIEMLGNAGNPTNSNRIIRIMSANIHDNVGYGINIDANSKQVVIGPDTLIHGNGLGDINDLGQNTRIELDVRHTGMASRVWDHVKALTIQAFHTLK